MGDSVHFSHDMSWFPSVSTENDDGNDEYDYDHDKKM